MRRSPAWLGTWARRHDNELPTPPTRDSSRPLDSRLARRARVGTASALASASEPATTRLQPGSQHGDLERLRSRTRLRTSTTRRSRRSTAGTRSGRGGCRTSSGGTAGGCRSCTCCRAFNTYWSRSRRVRSMCPIRLRRSIRWLDCSFAAAPDDPLRFEAYWPNEDSPLEDLILLRSDDERLSVKAEVLGASERWRCIGCWKVG